MAITLRGAATALVLVVGYGPSEDPIIAVSASVTAHACTPADSW
jgi:hypothetical protein